MIVNDHQQSPTSEAPSSAIAADWRDGSSYPAADAALGVFAWEFLRRSEQYADDFRSFARLVEAGATHAELTERHDQLARRWSVIAMVDPCRNEPPLWRGDARHVEAAANDGRYRLVDLAAPLRPQWFNVIDAALVWNSDHPEYAQPRALRIGGQRNATIYQECLRVHDATRQGIPKSEIKNSVWPNLDEFDQRGRLRHRTKRGRELIEGDYRALIADALLRNSLSFLDSLPLDGIR